MVGLICVLLLLGAAGGVGQAPVSQQHVERVRQLLQSPHPEDVRWLKTLFQSLTRLEHGPTDLMHEGWAWMAKDGTDAAQSNFILYCRRHQLPLPAPTLAEGADSTLERALALWGEGKLEACGQALQAGYAQYPQDSRYRNNLLWLQMEPPATLAANCTPGEMAQAILAARFSHT